MEKVNLSVAVFETPKTCGECPMSSEEGYCFRLWCNHPDGPGDVSKVMYSRRDVDCPLNDFSFEVEPVFEKPESESK